MANDGNKRVPAGGRPSLSSSITSDGFDPIPRWVHHARCQVDRRRVDTTGRTVGKGPGAPLSWPARCLLGTIARYQGANDAGWPSLARLAHDLALDGDASKRNVQLWLRELSDAGCLVKQSVGTGRVSSRYVVVRPGYIPSPLPAYEGRSMDHPSTGEGAIDGSSQGRSMDHLRGDQPITSGAIDGSPKEKNEQINKGEEEESAPPPPPRELRSALRERAAGIYEEHGKYDERDDSWPGWDKLERCAHVIAKQRDVEPLAAFELLLRRFLRGSESETGGHDLGWLANKPKKWWPPAAKTITKAPRPQDASIDAPSQGPDDVHAEVSAIIASISGKPGTRGLAGLGEMLRRPNLDPDDWHPATHGSPKDSRNNRTWNAWIAAGCPADPEWRAA